MVDLRIPAANQTAHGSIRRSLLSLLIPEVLALSEPQRRNRGESK